MLHGMGTGEISKLWRELIPEEHRKSMGCWLRLSAIGKVCGQLGGTGGV
jgi:hypothetical protein